MREKPLWKRHRDHASHLIGVMKTAIDAPNIKCSKVEHHDPSTTKYYYSIHTVEEMEACVCSRIGADNTLAIMDYG